MSQVKGKTQNGSSKERGKYLGVIWRRQQKPGKIRGNEELRAGVAMGGWGECCDGPKQHRPRGKEMGSKLNTLNEKNIYFLCSKLLSKMKKN